MGLFSWEETYATRILLCWGDVKIFPWLGAALCWGDLWGPLQAAIQKIILNITIITAVLFIRPLFFYFNVRVAGAGRRG